MPDAFENDQPSPYHVAHFLKPGVCVTDLRSGDNPEGEQTYPYFADGKLHEMPLTVAQKWAQRVAAANRMEIT